MFSMPITFTEQLVADRRSSYEAVATRSRLRRLFSHPASEAGTDRRMPRLAPVPVAAPRPYPAQDAPVRTVA